MKPAYYVISVFGGVGATARAIGYTAGAVSKWKLPASRQGCHGWIPRKSMQKILVVAKRRKLDITAEDLLMGRPGRNKFGPYVRVPQRKLARA